MRCLRGFGLVVVRPVIGVEGVVRVRIDDDLRILAGRLERRAHGVHIAHGNPAVCSAVETQHRRLQLAHDIERMARLLRRGGPLEMPVPGDTGARCRVMGGVQPGDPSAPAEADHPEA